MKNNRIKTLLSTLLISVSMLGISPMYANASEWKQDSKGWWLSEDNSYPRSSWRIVNNKWYYFGEDGYMKHDCYVDGYYLGSDGAWVEPSAGSNQGGTTVTESKPQQSTTNSNSSGKVDASSIFGQGPAKSDSSDFTTGYGSYSQEFADMIQNANR